MLMPQSVPGPDLVRFCCSTVSEIRVALQLTIARSLVVGACILCSDFAFGQVLPAGQSDFDALYQRVLSDPSNVDVSMRYAQSAKERGDYEAAISAYERLLLYNPSLGQLKYELGALYFELESYVAART